MKAVTQDNVYLLHLFIGSVREGMISGLSPLSTDNDYDGQWETVLITYFKKELKSYFRLKRDRR